MKLGGNPPNPPKGKKKYSEKELEILLKEADDHADYIYEEQPGELDDPEPTD